MTKEKLSTLYFEWLCQLTGHDGAHFKLLEYLYKTPFIYIFPMDGNRAEDGIDLRYKFGRKRGFKDALIASFLDISPCNVFEMMAALAFRCEEQIMWDPDIGNRTGIWFWEMIRSLGLQSMTDQNYDERKVDQVIQDFLNRNYDPDGRGGLFAIPGFSRDMRDIEIWYQMCAYLEAYYDA